ncbi:hypothetical protein LAUMK136_02683 [Mycobacterium attenuatum]|uniref:Uncharacterized protein n=1 Tax=Mycobacterium attenuatum TaxID=2341086 RepID=A0A498Q2T5_9MYCO|nr:hypothetical protein LAUMK136_02683 [Mycobacterium attenuatum]
MIGDRGIGPVGRKLQAIGHAGQRIFPKPHLRGQRTCLVGQIAEIFPLPHRVIGVLHRQFGPTGGTARTSAHVRHTHIGGQHADRPAVSGDVVHHNHQYMFLVADSEKPCFQRDFGLQVKGVVSRVHNGLGQPGRRPARCIDQLPAEIGLSCKENQLPRYPVDCRKHRAQAFVAAHHVGHGRMERGDIKVPGQPQRHRPVVDRRGTLQLVDEPQPALRERQRNHRRPLNSRQRPQPTPITADTRGQLGDGRRVEQRTHLEIGVQGCIDRGNRAHRRQRVATQVEKRLVDANPFRRYPENLDEDVDEHLLDRAVTIAVLVFRSRQRPAVDFAVGRQRQRPQHHHRSRHHVRRQPLRQLRACPGRVQRARERFGDITDQALVTGVLLTGDDHRLLDAGQVG